MIKSCRPVWIAFGLLLLILRAAPAQQEIDHLPIGAAAPNLDLLDMHGKQTTLDSFRGKAVLLNFWAFWCNTWEKEMPQLRELTRRQDDLGFRLLAISVDGTRLPEFTNRSQGDIPFPVLLDIGGALTKEYHVHHVPTVLILDSQGIVRYAYVAWPGNQVILNHLRKLSVSAPAGVDPSKSAVPPKPYIKRIRPQRRRR